MGATTSCCTPSCEWLLLCAPPPAESAAAACWLLRSPLLVPRVQQRVCGGAWAAGSRQRRHERQWPAGRAGGGAAAVRGECWHVLGWGRGRSLQHAQTRQHEGCSSLVLRCPPTGTHPTHHPPRTLQVCGRGHQPRHLCRAPLSGQRGGQPGQVGAGRAGQRASGHQWMHTCATARRSCLGAQHPPTLPHPLLQQGEGGGVSGAARADAGPAGSSLPADSGRLPSAAGAASGCGSGGGSSSSNNSCSGGGAGRPVRALDGRLACTVEPCVRNLTQFIPILSDQ